MIYTQENTFQELIEILCAVGYNLHIIINAINTPVGVLLLVKLLKVTLLLGCFSLLSNYANGTKSPMVLQLICIVDAIQRRIHNPVKQLRFSVLVKKECS